MKSEGLTPFSPLIKPQFPTAEPDAFAHLGNKEGVSSSLPSPPTFGDRIFKESTEQLKFKIQINAGVAA